VSKGNMRKALALTAAALAVVAGSVQLYAAVTVNSTNVPQVIPDNGQVTSTLSVDTTTVPGGAGFPTPWNLTDVNVTFSITHTWDDDVRVQITSPAVAAVTIMANCGGSGDNFTGTTIDDAGTAIGVANCQTSGAPVPFAGSFQALTGGGPGAQPPTAAPTALAAFNGTAANGTWTLTVADDSAVCTGTLDSWSITVDGPAPLPVELQNFDVK
jgi:subtilisin-like proprotein convertase family protein